MKPMKVFVGYLILWAVCLIFVLLSFAGEEINLVMLSIAMVVVAVGNMVILHSTSYTDVRTAIAIYSIV